VGTGAPSLKFNKIAVFRRTTVNLSWNSMSQVYGGVPNFIHFGDGVNTAHPPVLQRLRYA